MNLQDDEELKQSIVTTMKYNFTFSSANIIKTRSRENDTLAAGFGYQINNNGPAIEAASLGDFSSGQMVWPSLSLNDIELSDNDSICVAFALCNAYYTYEGEDAVKKLLQFVLSQSGVIPPSPSFW